MPSPSDGPCYYELLQLPPTAGVQELRQAFRRLSKRYHPDTTLLPADQAQEAFRRLQQAYAVLSDPEARRAYDNRRQAAMPRPGTAVRPPISSPRPVAAAKPLPVRRALSGGEWFALLLLAVALVLSMVLGLGVAWARGAELVRQPSWWALLQGDPAAVAAGSSPTDLELAIAGEAAAPAPAAPPGGEQPEAGGGLESSPATASGSLRAPASPPSSSP